MKDFWRHLAVALATAVVGAIGAALGQVAADAIRERWEPKPPDEDEPRRRKRRGAKR